MDTLHLKYPLVLLGSEGSALTPYSLRILMLCHCSSTMTKDLVLLISYGIILAVCKDGPKEVFGFNYETHHMAIAPILSPDQSHNKSLPLREIYILFLALNNYCSEGYYHGSSLCVDTYGI